MRVRFASGAQRKFFFNNKQDWCNGSTKACQVFSIGSSPVSCSKHSITFNEEVLDILTPEQVKKLKVIPIEVDDFSITFATQDPNDFNHTDKVSFIFPNNFCIFKHSSLEEINDFIDKNYRINEYEEFLKEFNEQY